MQYDYENYGIESFVVEVLEYCDECVKRDREQYYIDLLKPVENGYNSSHSAYTNDNLPPRYGEKNSFYGKHHTQETKDKISRANKGKLSGKNNPMYGVNMFEYVGEEKAAKIKAKKKTVQIEQSLGIAEKLT